MQDSGLHRCISPGCNAMLQPRGFISPQQVRDICKNGNWTARRDVAALGARLQEKPPVKLGWTWPQVWEACEKGYSAGLKQKFHGKGKNPKPLMIPGMGKVCFWLEEDWGLEVPCMRPVRVLGHEKSWRQWLVAPFLGYSLQFIKTLLFPGKLWNSVSVLCQKGWQQSCEEEDSQHYILMTSPCIWESRAHLASRSCLECSSN